MTILTPGRLLDLAETVFGARFAAGVQLWEANALLALTAPAGLAPVAAAGAVRSYAETQGLGVYSAPATPFPLVPTAPALIWWTVEERGLTEALARLLTQRYPAQHPVELAYFAAEHATIQAVTAIEALTLAALPSLPPAAAPFALLYLPALTISADQRGADGLSWVIARLLGPGGCPWDVRQTHQSLRSPLLEESYEVLEALDLGDMAALTEELGDLLLVIFVHSEMARQASAFDLGDVFAQSTAKLIRRHPHVFSELTVDGEQEIRRNWEQIKASELAKKGRSRPSVLDGVPPGLPALATAQKLGKKAAQAGFNWTDQAQVWAKIHEELEELAEASAAGNRAHAAEELGDILFVLTRLADWLHLDAEQALRDANHKFRRRFNHIEAAAARLGRPLNELSLAELLALWAEAKG